tara:strand:- start:6862 stop:7374 length:513 start_codon:yes stop_codon:yes gene_type:complete
MAIKSGINDGDTVFISQVDTLDALCAASKRPRGRYSCEADNKLTSLVGMIGVLVHHRNEDQARKKCKSGFCRAIVRFSLPKNFFKEQTNLSGESISPCWWDRAYKTEEDEGVQNFDILFNTGVKLEGISYMPSSLRYYYLKSTDSVCREFVAPSNLNGEKAKLLNKLDTE